MRRRTYVPLLLASAAGLMALGMVTPAGAASSGNGVANMSANQIAAAASSALTSATSFTYGGTVSSNGKSSTTGKPYLVKLSSPGSNGGTLTFTNYNKPVNVTAPPNPITVPSTTTTTG